MTFNIIFVSRLEKIRGAHFIPDIAKCLIKEKEDFRIDVLGRGPLTKDLDKPELNIYVHGWTSNVWSYYRNADCLLALQLTPVPGGINAIEAIAHQVPIIAFEGTGTGCITEQSRAGIVVESIGRPYDEVVKDLVDAIFEIMGHRTFTPEQKESIDDILRRVGYEIPSS